MEQKQVERLIFDNIEIDGCECAHALEVTTWPAAKLIVEVHEEECRTCARRTQEAILPCGHHASNAVMGKDGKARCEMCELVGQVVVLRTELECIANITEDGNVLMVRDVEHIRQLLSAAPKPEARLLMQLAKVPGGERVLVGTGQETWLSLGALEFERVYDVLVLAREQGQKCSRNPEQAEGSEQGYKRARGVIPWHEGDEKPEDVIARIRAEDVIARVRGRGEEEDDGNQ